MCNGFKESYNITRLNILVQGHISDVHGFVFKLSCFDRYILLLVQLEYKIWTTTPDSTIAATLPWKLDQKS